MRKERNGKGDYKNGSERLRRNKNLNPEKYGMVVCPVCKSNGYVQNPKRQCCPKCGGFGFIKKEMVSCNNEGQRD
jgi:uncharacterized OB-fold protein